MAPTRSSSDSGAGAGGVVPYLPLSELPAARAAAAQSAPQQQQQPQLQRQPRRYESVMRLGMAASVIVIAVVAAIIGYSAIFTVYERASGAGGAARRPDPGGQRSGTAFQGPVHRHRHLRRQANPRSGESPAQEIIASDQKRLVVDAFARYRIVDPLQFYQTRRLDRRRQLAARRPCSIRRCAACSARRR